jgi:hypothetical protein
MAHVTVENNLVIIELSTMDKIWAVHGGLKIPLAHIKSARVEDENGWDFWWRKIAGTTAPGLKTAGTFFANGGLAFLDFGTGRSCVVLETEHETYKTVIVQPGDDPDRIAAEINRRIGR